MQTKGNTVLIIGGATGIGFAMAEAFTSAGNEVLICSHRQEKLNAAKQRLPSLHTHTCDVTDESARRELFEWAMEEFPALNILINNAGIIRAIDLKNGDSAADTARQELAVDLQAPFETLKDSVDENISLDLQRIDARPKKGMVKFVFDYHYWGGSLMEQPEACWPLLAYARIWWRIFTIAQF